MISVHIYVSINWTGLFWLRLVNACALFSNFHNLLCNTSYRSQLRFRLRFRGQRPFSPSCEFSRLLSDLLDKVIFDREASVSMMSLTLCLDILFLRCALCMRFQMNRRLSLFLAVVNRAFEIQVKLNACTSTIFFVKYLQVQNTAQHTSSNIKFSRYTFHSNGTSYEIINPGTSRSCNRFSKQPPSVSR
jgi:hypothetical protein